MPLLKTRRPFTKKNMNVTISSRAYALHLDISKGGYYLKSPRNLTVSSNATLVIDSGVTLSVPTGKAALLTHTPMCDPALDLWPQTYWAGERRITVKFTNTAGRPIFVKRGRKLAQITMINVADNCQPRYTATGLAAGSEESLGQEALAPWDNPHQANEPEAEDTCGPYQHPQTTITPTEEHRTTEQAAGMWTIHQLGQPITWPTHRAAPKQAEFAQFLPMGVPDTTTYWYRSDTATCENCWNLGYKCYFCEAKGITAPAIAADVTELMQLADFVVRSARATRDNQPPEERKKDGYLVNYAITVKPLGDGGLQINAVTYEGYGIEKIPGKPTVNYLPLLKETMLPDSALQHLMNENLRLREAQEDIDALDKKLNEVVTKGAPPGRNKFELIFEIATDIMFAVHRFDTAITDERWKHIKERIHQGEEARAPYQTQPQAKVQEEAEPIQPESTNSGICQTPAEGGEPITKTPFRRTPGRNIRRRTLDFRDLPLKKRIPVEEPPEKGEGFDIFEEQSPAPLNIDEDANTDGDIHVYRESLADTKDYIYQYLHGDEDIDSSQIIYDSTQDTLV